MPDKTPKTTLESTITKTNNSFKQDTLTPKILPHILQVSVQFLSLAYLLCINACPQNTLKVIAK